MAKNPMFSEDVLATVYLNDACSSVKYLYT